MLLFKDCTPSPHPSFVHILLTHACWKDLYSALRLCSSTSSAVTSPYSLPHSQERGAFYSVIPQESHFPCKDSHCVISSWPVLCPKLWSPWGQCLQLFISPGTSSESLVGTFSSPTGGNHGITIGREARLQKASYHTIGTICLFFLSF